jgi:hypothetical protein
MTSPLLKRLLTLAGVALLSTAALTACGKAGGGNETGNTATAPADNSTAAPAPDASTGMAPDSSTGGDTAAPATPQDMQSAPSYGSEGTAPETPAAPEQQQQ